MKSSSTKPFAPAPIFRQQTVDATADVKAVPVATEPVAEEKPALQYPPVGALTSVKTPLPAGKPALSPFDLLRSVLQDKALPQTPEQKKADAAADVVMRGVVKGSSDHETRAEVTAYASEIADRVRSGVPLTVHEHTAVSFLLRVGMFDDTANTKSPLTTEDLQLNKQVREQLTFALKDSWQNLTGKEQPESELLTRLPTMALRKASRHDRVYHAASFQPLTQDRATRLAASSLFRDYVPENQDIAIATGALLAAVFTDAGRFVVAGQIAQYVMHTVTENVLHDHLAHPKGRAGEWLMNPIREGAGWLQRTLHKVFSPLMAKQVEWTAAAHVDIHHFKTYREHMTKMFDEHFTQEKVDQYIDKSFPPELADRVKKDLYATTLDLRGMIKIGSTIAPQTLVMIGVGVMLGAPAWMLIPTVVTAALYPLAMGKGHPIFHVPVAEAEKNATPFMKWLRSTRYIAYSARNHGMHHFHPNVNFNLSYPGADALLGQLMQPNLADLYREADDDMLHT